MAIVEIKRIRIRDGNEADLQADKLLDNEPINPDDTHKFGIKQKDGSILWMATTSGPNQAAMVGAGANQAVLKSQVGKAGGVAAYDTILPILRGGTGATTAAQALINLGAIQKLLDINSIALPNIKVRSTNNQGSGLLSGMNNGVILHFAYDMGDQAPNILVTTGILDSTGYHYVRLGGNGSLTIGGSNGVGTVALTSIGARDPFIKQTAIYIHQVDGWATT